MNEATVPALGFSDTAFDAFLASRQEPDWSIAQRQVAWQAVQSMAMPSRNEEEWMRTDVRTFKLDDYRLPGETTDSGSAPAVLAENVELAGAIATVNGTNVRSELSDKWRSKGVIFGGLAQLAEEHSELIEKYMIAKDGWPDRFAALHAACWSSGTLLYVPRGVVVDQPLHTQSTITDGGVDFGHTLVVLEDGAEATFLNEMGGVSAADRGFHCGATNVIVGDGARMRFVNLQDWGHETWHFAHQKARVGRDATLQWTVGALGSRLSKVNQQVELVGPGAECQVNGVMFTEGRQHLSYHTLQHHQAPHCRSDFLYKAALQDKSRTVWRGMIKVDVGAQKTDGYQRNDNLLLSHHARADAIPGLEIEADDVRCTHGATTGQVDEELIFYAQSRGFTRREAVRLVVTGFFQQVFDRITIESVREALGHAIARRVREYE